MDIGPAAIRVLIMIMMMNTMLFVTGNIPSDQVPVISSLLRDLELSDTNTSDFQKNWIIRDDANAYLETPTGESFATTVLDFIQKIPLIGPIVTFFRIIYEAIVTATFGFSIILLKLQLPNVIKIPILVLNFLVMLFALFEFMQSFVAARGGLK